MKKNKIIFILLALNFMITQGCVKSFNQHQPNFNMSIKSDIFETFHIAYFPSNLPIIDMHGPIYSVQEGYYLGKIDIMKNGMANVHLVSDVKKKVGSKYEKGFDSIASLNGLSFKDKFCKIDKEIISNEDKKNFTLCLYETFEFKMVSTIRMINSDIGEKYFQNSQINSKNQELQKAIKFTSREDWERFKNQIPK